MYFPFFEKNRPQMGVKKKKKTKEKKRQTGCDVQKVYWNILKCSTNNLCSFKIIFEVTPPPKFFLNIMLNEDGEKFSPL